jgi:plastocyanin
MPKTLHRALCLVAVAALPLAACGGDDDSSGSGSGDTTAPAGDVVEVTAKSTLEFDPTALEASAGEITFRLVNDGSLPHTFVIEGHESDMKLSVGDSDEGTITLDEGDYTFYCDVAGHRAAGMEGTLTVGSA